MLYAPLKEEYRIGIGIISVIYRKCKTNLNPVASLINTYTYLLGSTPLYQRALFPWFQAEPATGLSVQHAPPSASPHFSSI